MPTSPTWTLLLGGRPRLQASDGRLLTLDGVDPWLLAWLALEGPTPRSRLMALLWPDEEPGTTLRNRLRQRLFALKRRVGAEVVSGGETLALGADVQWPGFEATADDGTLLETPPAGASPELLDCLAGWRERQHATQRDRSAADAARLEREGRLAEAIDLAERRVRLEPLQEHAHRQLIRLHYLRGDRAAAIAAFERCERCLKDEFGVRPAPETLELLALVESAAPPPAPAVRPVAASLLRPPRLVGRDTEWRQLGEAWARHLPVVLVGEGGLGKSRLLADLAAAQQAPVLHVAARPGDAVMPLTFLCRVLRAVPSVQAQRLPPGTLRELARLLPELGDAPPTLPDTELRLQQAVRSAMADSPDLFALALDDLHLADAASLDLLRTLLADAGPVWAAALRPGPQPPALQAFVQALLDSGQATRVELQPLGLPAIVEFCDSLGLPGLEGRHWAAPLLQRTGGNPQYMLEMLKAWWLVPGRGNDDGKRLPVPPGRGLASLPTPVSLPGLVRQRIETLSPAAVDLARCAAVAQEDFSPDLAAAVLRLRPVDLADPWAELEAARVFDGEHFAHDLIAEAASASVPAAVARALHAQVAAALQQGASAQPVEPARLAHHWREAGRWPAAAQAYEAAAQRCAGRGRRAAEADAWGHAADAWLRAGQVEARFDALAQRAAVLVQYGGDTQAREALDALEAEARLPVQQQHLAAMRLAHAQHMGDFEATLRLAPAVIDAAWAEGGPRAALGPMLNLAGALAKHYRGHEAVTLLERLRAWIDGPEAGDDERRRYWNAVALALDFANRFGEALSAWRQTQHFARQARSDLLCQALGNEAFTLHKMGRMAAAVERGREALRLALGQGDDLGSQIGYQRMALGHHLRNIGQLDEALALLLQAREAMQAHGHHADAAVATHLLAVTWVHLGQADRAHRLLADPLPTALPARLQLMRDAHRVMVSQAMGERGAQHEARQLAASLDHDDAENLLSRIAVLLIAPALPPEEREPLALRVAGWFSARGRMGHALAAHVLAGTAALDRGEPDRALTQVQAAEELAREHQPDIVYGPLRWWLAARVLAALGRDQARRASLHAARSWVQTRADAMAPELRRAFLDRQPVNVDLLRWSAG